MTMLQRLLRPDCHRVRQVLQSWLDGELAESDAAAVAVHLLACDRCRIEAELYEQVKASLASLRAIPDPEAVARLRWYADRLATPIDDPWDPS